MNILGYPVIGQVRTTAGLFPLVDIPIMNDERWKELARENAVRNYTREHGHDPESVEAAVIWQREWIAHKEEGTS